MAGEAYGGVSGTPHKTSIVAIPDVRSRSNSAMDCAVAPRPSGTTSESDSFELAWLCNTAMLGRALSQPCLRYKVEFLQMLAV